MFISKFGQLGARAMRSPAVRGLLFALSVNVNLDFKTLCAAAISSLRCLLELDPLCSLVVTEPEN